MAKTHTLQSRWRRSIFHNCNICFGAIGHRSHLPILEVDFKLIHSSNGPSLSLSFYALICMKFPTNTDHIRDGVRKFLSLCPGGVQIVLLLSTFPRRRRLVLSKHISRPVHDIRTFRSICISQLFSMIHHFL